MFKIRYDSSINGTQWLQALLSILPGDQIFKLCPNLQQHNRLGLHVPSIVLGLGNAHYRRFRGSRPYETNLQHFKTTILTPELADIFNPVSEATAMQEFLELDPDWLPMLETAYNYSRQLSYMYVVDQHYFRHDIIDIHQRGYAVLLSNGQLVNSYRFSPNGYSYIHETPFVLIDKDSVGFRAGVLH